MMKLCKSFILSYFSSRLPNFKRIPTRQLFIDPVNKSKTQLSDKQETEELDEELQAKEEYIKKQQNKSKLSPADYNRQNGRMPYEKPQWEYHETLRYKRRLYGKYGQETKINPSILWPSYEEMEAMKEYESVAQPYSFHELVDKAAEKRRIEEEAKEAERAEILARVKNVKKELLEFHKRVQQKNEEAKKVIERKNAMIDEVKKHFGYNISVNDKKFKEMLLEYEQKHRKELKLSKAEKRAKKRELIKNKAAIAPPCTTEEKEKQE